MREKRFKLCMSVVHYGIEGTVSQISYLGLRFHLMKSGKLTFSYLDKIKTMALRIDNC